jgi:hypothetical protein
LSNETDALNYPLERLAKERKERVRKGNPRTYAISYEAISMSGWWSVLALSNVL